MGLLSILPSIKRKTRTVLNSWGTLLSNSTCVFYFKNFQFQKCIIFQMGLFAIYYFDKYKNYSSGNMTDCKTVVSNNQAFAALAVKFGFHHHLKTCGVLDRLAIDAFMDEQNRESNPLLPDWVSTFFHFHWCWLGPIVLNSDHFDCYLIG